jgi:sodium-dependent dicarboxylate transporter 2/3/5
MTDDIPPGATRLELWLGNQGRRIGLIAAPVVFIVLLVAPLPGLTAPAHRLLAVVGLATVLWVTEAVPLAATALLAPALCVVFGVGGAGAIFAPFGSPTTFLFIGMFIVGLAMQKHGLDRRVALTVLCWPGIARSPTAMFAALAALTAALSMWMSNIAAAAVMIPIGLGVLGVNPGWGGEPRHQGALVLLIAFSASMGGLATPVGTPPNLIGLSLLEEMTGRKMHFFEWMGQTLPLSAALVAFLVWRLRPSTVPVDPASTRAELARARAALGARTPGETSTAAVFLGAVTLWVYPGLVEMLTGGKTWGAGWLEARLPEEMIGLLAGVLLFFLPGGRARGEFAITWTDAVKLDWSTIVLFGGGVALGRQIFETGLAEAGGRAIIGFLGQPSLVAVVLTAVGASMVLSTLTSNTASANVVVPMMLSVALAARVEPAPVALAACLACSFGNSLPISTGTNALAYGTGHVRLPDMMRHGFWLDAVGAILVAATVLWLVD